MPVATYYFDASDAGPTDPGGVWINDADLFDASDVTGASTGTFGSKSSNYLEAKGTTAPTSGGSITQVRARIRYDDGASTVWSSYSTVSAPGGGWSWSGVNNLETRVWLDNASGGTAEIYETGTAGGTALGSLGYLDDGSGSALVIKIEIEVTSATASLAITTNAVTAITTTTATGNGNITDVTSGNADERGIVYSTSTQAAPGNVAPGSSGYSGLVNETGSFSTGAFTESLTGLSQATRYYARAYAHNTTDGYIYGSEVNFITGLSVAWFKA